MKIIKIPGIKIEGISAAVPKSISYNENKRFKQLIGISEKRISDPNTCASDLCLAAANKLINDLDINVNDIGVILFVSQTPDYKLPNTSAILQHKLGISEDCICFDIPLGCSGYTYGLYTISSLLKTSNSKYGLLLAGDTISKQVNVKDNSTAPLFGDCGTATIVALDETQVNPICFNLGTDGSGYDSIIIPHGGSRNPITHESFVEEIDGSGNIRSKQDLYLDGTAVYEFGTNKISDVLNEYINELNIDLDCLVLHQANKLMNDRIVKKINIDNSKALSSLNDFGNTSSATIPLTLVTKLHTLPDYKNIVMCGFGVGLSWAISSISQNNVYCSNLIEI